MASSGTGRLEELVQRLILATENASVEWQETDRPSSYMSVFGGPSIEILSADSDGSSPYVLQIRNDQGVVIETIHSQSRTGWPNVTWDLSKLYELARREATNVDGVLNEIMSDLPTLPATPEPAPEPTDPWTTEPSDQSGFTDEPPF